MTADQPLSLRPAAMAELLKPSTLEVYECLRVAGPSSVADLAARLGRPADALYYHVRKLVKLGVVERRVPAEDAGERRGGPGRRGALYGTLARVVQMELDTASRKGREAWLSGAAAVLRLAEREVRAAVETGDVRTQGPLCNLRVRRVRARLTDRELRRVNALQSELEQLLSSRTDNPAGRLLSATLVITPLDEPTR